MGTSVYNHLKENTIPSDFFFVMEIQSCDE